MSVEADFVAQWEMSSLTVTERQRQFIILLESLILLALLADDDGGVLRIQPRSLHRRLLLVVEIVTLMHFAGQTRSDFHTLLVEWPGLAESSLHRLGVVEISLLSNSITLLLIVESISIRCVSVWFIVARIMLVNN